MQHKQPRTRVHIDNALALQSNQQPHTLTVYNISGRQVEKYYTTTNAFYIQPMRAANGLYLFTIADDKEIIKLKGKLLILQ